MGMFTWLDASDRRKRIRYGNTAYLIAPDNTVYKTGYYRGYGMFSLDGKAYDVYELVVDWNRGHLSDILSRKMAEKGDKFWGSEIMDIAATADFGDKAALEKAEERWPEIPEYLMQVPSDWKRAAGIMIAGTPEDNASIPYPIKVTGKRPCKRYEALKPSPVIM